MNRLLLACILFVALSHPALAQTTTERLAALEKRATAAERRVADLEAREQAYRRFVLWQACAWNRNVAAAGPLAPALGFTPLPMAQGTVCPAANFRMNVPQ